MKLKTSGPRRRDLRVRGPRARSLKAPPDGHGPELRQAPHGLFDVQYALLAQGCGGPTYGANAEREIDPTPSLCLAGAMAEIRFGILAILENANSWVNIARVSRFSQTGGENMFQHFCALNCALAPC